MSQALPVERSPILIDRRLLAQAEQIHTIYPIRNIESSYRSASHNAAIGGASSSWHLRGGALDLTFDSPKDLLPAARYAQKLGITGILVDLTDQHLHVDIRPSAWHVVWKTIRGKKKEWTLTDYFTIHYETFTT